MLKGSPIVARLLSLSKSGSATGETKSKIIRIVTSLSKDTPPVAPPSDIPKKSRYENVNIRLYSNEYEDDYKVQEPAYAPKPRSRHEDGFAPKPRAEPVDQHTFTFDAGRKRSKPTKSGYSSGQDSSLRKVGYSAIHDNKKNAYDYSYEESKLLDAPSYESPMNSYSRKVNANKYSKPETKYDEEYTFPLEGGARRDPTIKIPFNDSLLHDYCLMLDKENNRDINIFSIQSLAPLIKDCARNIINDPEKFMAVFNLIEMFTMPFEIQDMQYKIIDTLTEYMNENAAKE